MSKLRHVLGISGGKDSSALAIYLKQKYPEIKIEYYTADTGKELDETYKLIKNLEIFLGEKIKILNAAENSPEAPFDHFLQMYGGFLPSSNARWCTKKLKLDPFEKFVGDDLVISYVGIRGDENREGYISKKSNIQSIFPFRRNIWSEDVIAKFLSNENIQIILKYNDSLDLQGNKDRRAEILATPISQSFTQLQKMNILLDLNIRDFNKLIFSFLKTTKYPLSQVNEYPLLDNDDVLVRDDIFKLLETSGVGVPEYYKKREFDVDGKIGFYSRSRSGCYFCFFQQKIEWIWLYENHNNLFIKAMSYEKDGFTWMQDERLEDLINPDRIRQIKLDQIKKNEKKTIQQSPYLLDILGDTESDGCASCFI